MKKLFALAVAVMLAVCLINQAQIGETYGSFVDTESSSGNAFTAFNPSRWVQTTQTDFNLGVLNNVDISSSPGDVRLARDGWYNTGWSYRKKITINHTRVQDVAIPSTTYSNFPVLVYAAGLSNISANGADIRFTLSDGFTEIAREIEGYSAGILYAWVKVTLTKDSSDSADDVIYMYYGNPAATEPASNSTYGAQNVWTNYSAIWHLKENPSGTAPQMKDSTLNSLNGTTIGAMPSGASVPGIIGNSLQFDGSNDGVNTSSSLSINSTFTLEGWAKFSSIPSAWQTIVQGGAAGNIRDLTIYKDGSGITSIDFYDGVDNYFNTAISTGSWYHIAATFSSSTLTVYLNGLSVGTVSKSYTSSSGRASMGYSIGLANDYLNGYLDEVRISSVARTSSWIRTEFNNQNSPATFYSLGVQEGFQFVSSGSQASPVLDTLTIGARWDCLAWDSIPLSGTTINFEVRTSDTTFVKDAASPLWVSVGGISPVASGLPAGRYKQWRANIATSDTSKTPTLNEIRVYYH